jgi:hypothetical protein
MKSAILSISIVSLLLTGCYSQSAKYSRYFGEPIVADSSSTFFFPIQYNEELLSANKIALGGDYYANIIVYDFLSDTYQKLFEVDTYIKSLQVPHYFPEGPRAKPMNLTSKWVFLLVKNTDYNTNGRIDERDPTILFVTTTAGKNLMPLTSSTENVVSLKLFEKQGFALLRIQRDEDHDHAFKVTDGDFYYRKISLHDLSVGKGIELK